MYSLWQDLSHGTIILTYWPWPWSLTYFSKTLTLAITFKPDVIGHSYFTCVFLVTRPFTWYHNFWPSDLDIEVWPTFKNYNLGHNFQTRCDRAFILHNHVYSLWQDISHGTIIFDLVTLTLNFDLHLKNFNLGCYLVMVAAQRASLSSDNSYYRPHLNSTWSK